MKRILLILIGLLLTIELSARDFTYTYEGQTITYTVLNEVTKTCKTKDGYSFGIDGYPGNNVTGHLILPANPKEKDTEYTLTQIGIMSFYGLTDLTSVEIPISVIEIEKSAFADCSGLTSVVLPNSITTIGNSAFWGCRGLTSVALPTSLNSIGESAFYRCSGLTSVEIPNSVTSIGNSAFRSCTELTSVSIPDSVTSISGYAFYMCSRLMSVSIPNSVISIEQYAFQYCSSLTSLEIGNSVKSIGSYAFANCGNLSNVLIPNSVTSIGGCAFQDCTGLVSLEIGSSLSSIGVLSFANCSKLKSVVIPNSVTYIMERAFQNCSGLVKSAYPNTLSNPFNYGIQIPYNPEGAIIEDGWVYGPDKTSILFAPINIDGECIIPNTVTLINDNAFQGCYSMTSVEIPNSVTLINDNAFQGCYGLTSVEIPNSVTLINNNAFQGCYGLTSVEIPNSVTLINDNAFQGCYGLTSVEIPNSVTEIGEKAFLGCRGLLSLKIGESVTKIGDSAFSKCSQLSSVVVPNSVIELGISAFRGCSGLISAVLGNSIRIIGADAFSGCEQLKKSAYPATIKNPFMKDAWDSYGIAIAYNPFGSIIEDGFVFGRNKSAIYFAPLMLQGEYTVPETVSVIGCSAFRECDKLSTITIGKGVTMILDYAFFDCPNLRTLNFNAEKCNICGDWDEIFGNKFHPAFSNSLETLIIGEEVTEIPQYAFSGCSGLTSVKISDSVTNIGDYAFQDCTGISSAIIGTSVQKIGEGVFKGCDSLIELYFNAKNCTACGRTTSREYYSPFSDNIKTLIIGDQVVNIPENCFNSLSNLTSVKIGSSIKKIGNEAFIDCFALTSADFSNLESLCNINFLSETSNPLVYAHNLLINGVEVTDLVIPETVSSIGDYAFSRCSGLRSVMFGDSVRIIGYQTFSGCNALKSVEMGINVRSLGERCFSGCSSLSNINIPNNVVEIGSYAFSGCEGLTSIVIPNSINNIGRSAFAECHALSSIVIGNSIETIDFSAFYGCPIKDISITAQMPPEIQYDTFTKYDGILYLQGEEAISRYKATQYWNKFKMEPLIEPLTLKIEGETPIIGNVGDTFQLTAKITPEDVSLPYVYWSSTNPEIATVSKNGVVTLHANVNENTDCTIKAETLYADGLIADITVGFKYIEVSEITLSQTDLEMKPGQSSRLTATIHPEDATDNSVIWSSSDELVATVDFDGYVTASSVGEADIIVTAADGSGVSAICHVTVLPIPVESIILTPDSWNGEEGMTFQIEASVLPDNASDKKLRWASSDKNVAIVDEDGFVAVLKEGTCAITANASDGSGIYAECIITSFAGIDEIFTDGETLWNVYDINGSLLKKNCDKDDLNLLGSGVYILHSERKTIKIILR